MGYALVSMESGILGDIASRFSAPIFATSVNVSGEITDKNLGPSISIKEVKQFIEKSDVAVELLIDGGLCPLNNHTTIVDGRNFDKQPVICREGVVHRRVVEAVLKNDY
jgi:tRNA A37 threonylcarbamoyladenosine synthetase subunit TsaC/SUA5/YrdC